MNRGLKDRENQGVIIIKNVTVTSPMNRGLKVLATKKMTHPVTMVTVTSPMNRGLKVEHEKLNGFCQRWLQLLPRWIGDWKLQGRLTTKNSTTLQLLPRWIGDWKFPCVQACCHWWVVTVTSPMNRGLKAHDLVHVVRHREVTVTSPMNRGLKVTQHKARQR